MYTIIKSEFMGYEGNKTVLRVELVVDTAEDLPAADDCWSAGSMALIADTREIMILNNEGVWV